MEANDDRLWIVSLAPDPRLTGEERSGSLKVLDTQPGGRVSHLAGGQRHRAANHKATAFAKEPSFLYTNASHLQYKFALRF